MDIVKANIVTSTAGRDKGEVFFVLATEGDFLLLADGKTRPVERLQCYGKRPVRYSMIEQTSHDTCPSVGIVLCEAERVRGMVIVE